MKILIVLVALFSAAAWEQVPIPADYDAKVKRYLESTLKDPFSVVLEQTKAPNYVQGVIRRGLLRKQPYQGWLACYRINAKNSYGAYTGFKSAAFLLTDDGAVHFYEGDDDPIIYTWDEQLLGNHCAS